MTQNAYYRHLDGQRYRCEIIDQADTQVKVRLTEQTAQELRLDQELWLPRSYVQVEG